MVLRLRRDAASRKLDEGVGRVATDRCVGVVHERFDGRAGLRVVGGGQDVEGMLEQFPCHGRQHRQ